jgi:hypothetical protein
MIVLDAMTTLFGKKQQDNESLRDYMKWFRVARDVLESQFGGPIAPTKYVEQESNYDPMFVKECQKTVSKEFLTVLYLKNADQKKIVLSYKVSTPNSLYIMTNTQRQSSMPTMCWAITSFTITSHKPANLERTKISLTRTPRMIKKTKTNKKFPCHLPRLKEDATVVASQATDHLIVERKT